MADAIEQGGYSCEFVDQPPEAVQVECPVCLLIVREPHIVSCCGYSYCKSCIVIVQTGNKACPTCKEERFTIFPNKGLQRMLLNFSVRCSNEKEGCKWAGELGSLDNHLNTYPQLETDERLEGCALVKVKCTNCGDALERIKLKKHQNDQCSKRPYSCNYCQFYKTFYDDVIENHWPVCGSKPVQCPNECGENPLRQHLDKHIASDCPLTLSYCDFPGCGTKLTRKDMPHHLKEDMVEHMSLLAKSHNQLESENKRLTDCQKLLESENQALKRRVAQLEKEEVKHTEYQKQTEVDNQTRSLKIAELESKEAKRTESQQQHKKEHELLEKRVVEMEAKVTPLWRKVFIIGVTNSGW